MLFRSGQKVETQGPLLASHAVEGGEIRLKFTHVGQGLAARHSEKLQGFAIAGADKKFVWADAVIDGELVDVKSTTSMGIKKFADGSLAEDDPFGYISQISGYANALGKKTGTFLAFDKSAGDLVTYTHYELEDTSKKIANVKEVLAKDAPPPRPFDPAYDKTAGRKKLGINCSYCSFKEHCWADRGLDIQFKSGKPVFYLKDNKNDFSF